MNDTTYDFIAIGLGPFNLGLACLTEPLDDANGLFLDRNECFNWHPGMLLETATLQTPFMADMVTLADPTSKFSFLNYVKSQGRIYAFYIKEDFFLMRNEYNQYCQWVIAQLPNIAFNRYVEQVEFDEQERCYNVHSICTKTGARIIYRARKLVLGTGTTPYIPSCCQPLSDKIRHTSSYLHDKAEIQAKKSITIVGSGQSAAEVYYDLLQDIEKFNYTLNWITRAPRFFPMEYSKLTLEMTSPEYIDYFHQLPASKRDQLMKAQKGLYKGINIALINAIYDLLYNKKIAGEIKTNLLTNADLKQCSFDEDSQRFSLSLHQMEQQQYYRLQTEALILATGYTYRMPAFLKTISSKIKFDEQGRFSVARNYSITEDNNIFVQNAELHTHGLVTPDLGMGCYRNSYIIKEMTGVEHYPIERTIAFQQFSVPEMDVISAEDIAEQELKQKHALTVAR